MIFFKGTSKKLLYIDFEIYLEQITDLNEGAMRASEPTTAKPFLKVGRL